MQTAMITGATGGIGQELARQLDKRGYRLVLLDMDRSALKAMSVLYPDAEIHVLDQSNTADVDRFCDERIERGSPLDIAILNAGTLAIGDLTELSREDVTRQLDVNLRSNAVMIHALAQRMCQDGSGHILATVSIGGIVSLKGSSVYSASKFGLRALLWALRDEVKDKGVKVSGIFPAGVDTPMLRHEALNGGSALNFLGTPVTTKDVVGAFMRAIDRPRLETYVPMSEGITGRLAGAWPGLLAWLYPLLEKFGERGRKKFIARMNEAAKD